MAGIEPDRERSIRNLLRSPAIATIFAKKIGYAEASKLVKDANRQKLSFVELAIEKGLLTKAEILNIMHESTRFREGSED